MTSGCIGQVHDVADDWLTEAAGPTVLAGLTVCTTRARTATRNATPEERPTCRHYSDGESCPSAIAETVYGGGGKSLILRHFSRRQTPTSGYNKVHGSAPFRVSYGRIIHTGSTYASGQGGRRARGLRRGFRR